jgi:hypothetical protein
MDGHPSVRTENTTNFTSCSNTVNKDAEKKTAKNVRRKKN